jgi:hypothetical protein
LYLDVDCHDNVTLPPGEPWDQTASCALDIAEEGPLDLREIGEILHVSAERVRQIEAMGLRKLRRGGRLGPRT